MQNIPDNKLDDFFKGKSENARIAFDPKAWNKMEQKLESAYSKRIILRRFFLLSLLLLLVLSSIVSWQYLSLNERDISAPNVAVKESEQKLSETQIEETIDLKDGKRNLNKTARPATERKASLNIGEETNTKTSPTNEIDRIDSNQSLEDKMTKSRRENSGKTFNKNSNESTYGQNFTNPQIPTHSSEKKEEAKKLALGSIENSNNPQGEVQNDETNKLKKDLLKADQILFEKESVVVNGKESIYDKFYLFTLLNKGFMLDRSGLKLASQLSFSPKEDIGFTEEYVSTSKKDIKPRQQSALGNRVRLSFQVSPDVSSALGIQFGKTGYNLGISLEYFLLSKLSVSASLLKANKVYTSNPDCYEFPSSYTHKPEKIDGSCVVWDVPINIRYYYFSSSKVRTYASAGISSYIMRKEAYKYEYYTYSSTYKYPKGNNHLFSIINFSVGAEYKLSERFSVGIEPFLKIPMKGVGEGKIKLNTAGAFLSVNYNLFKR